MAKKSKEVEAIKAKIIAKAWKDPKFKKKLMENPRAALKEMGVAMPNDININIIEEGQGSYTLVLPQPRIATEELSEKEIEKIVGGAGGGLSRDGKTCW